VAGASNGVGRWNGEEAGNEEVASAAGRITLTAILVRCCWCWRVDEKDEEDEDDEGCRVLEAPPSLLWLEEDEEEDEVAASAPV
jgi:hypothetical protein